MEPKEKGLVESKGRYVWDADKRTWVGPSEPAREEGLEEVPAEGAAVETEVEAEELEYRGAWIRLIAFIIDAVVLVIILVIIRGSITESAFQSYLALAVILIYFAGFWAWRGQTPGKMVIGAKVVKTNGQPIGVGRAILRSICYMVYFFVLGYAGGFGGEEVSAERAIIALLLVIFFLLIITAFSRTKRGPHDWIASTCVVRSR